MRMLLAIAVILGVTLALAEPSDARRKWRTYKGGNTVCIRARDQDPAGDYKKYRCWARFALSPKTRER